jgi:hypothetical protein
MFDAMDNILNGFAPLVVRDEVRVTGDQVAGSDIVRLDDLRRSVIVVPAGQQVPAYVQLTPAEKAALRPAVEVTRVHEAGSYRLTGW